jgi:acetate kinase
MNLWILTPKAHFVGCSCYRDSERAPAWSEWIPNDRGHKPGALAGLRARHAAVTGKDSPGAIAIRVAFGGEQFNGPALANDATVSALRAMVSCSPLHLPLALELVDNARILFPELPIILFFETSFFSNLPLREHTYGID